MSEPSPFAHRILSDAHLAEAAARFPRLGPYMPQGERAFGLMLDAVEILGVGGVMSYLNARAPNGKATLLGLPADVSLGAAFVGLSFMGYFGVHASHATNVGIGMLGAAIARYAQSWGRGLVTAEVIPLPHATRGAFPAPVPPPSQNSPDTSPRTYYPSPRKEATA